MKKTKIILLVCMCFLISSCFKRDTFEDIKIYTTYYPIKYITKELYGKYSDIFSIYPLEVAPENYKLTAKQVKKYSKSEVFIYNGLSEEKRIAADFINKNDEIKLVDATQGLEVNNDMSELWISPSNCLMIAQNIKNALKENITSKYIKNEVDENYEELRLKISEIEAEIKIINENATHKTIIVDSSMFRFLEKYGYEVVVLLNENNETSITAYNRAKELFNSKKNNTLFIKEGNNITEDMQKLIDDYKISSYTFKTINNLTEVEEDEGSNYITIMKQNVEALRNEMYTEK